MKQVKIMLHSGISREYRKRFDVPYKEFWQSTKTLFIKDKEASWRITGYIIGNLLKHREVSTFQELKENPFSSYKYTAEKLGDETARELVYSTIRIEEDVEGRVNMKGLCETEVRDRIHLINKPPPRVFSTLPMAGVKPLPRAA